jgi:branched-chain amino acid transport system ATP-binding protein
MRAVVGEETLEALQRSLTAREADSVDREVVDQARVKVMLGVAAVRASDTRRRLLSDRKLRTERADELGEDRLVAEVARNFREPREERVDRHRPRGPALSVEITRQTDLHAIALLAHNDLSKTPDPDYKTCSLQPCTVQYTVPALSGAELLTVTGVTKRFGGVEALAGCSLAVRQGSITGLIGPNGAGKTTLFNVITGLTPAGGGEIRLDGDRLDGLSAHAIARRGVGRTFQIPRPLGRMTVLENVLVYAHDHPGEALTRVFAASKRVRAEETRVRERALAILESVDLAHLATARAETLSGGQKKLLELARALMSDPRIILLDEPGAGVNPTLMRSLVEGIRALQKAGRTFLLIEHDMDLVTELCDPVIVMAQGRKLMEGPFAEVRRDPRVLEAYLGTAA